MADDFFSKPTILIAEDEEINRTILREILKNKYRILEAENGQQAVFYIQAEDLVIDLLILDIHMPKLDGFGVMDYLIEKGLNTKIPIIVTTADESSDVLVQAKQNKVVDIVYKPFRAGDIQKTVDTLVEICKLEKNLEKIIEEKSIYLTNQYEVMKKALIFRHQRWEETVKRLMSDLLPGNEEHNLRIRAYTECLATKVMNTYPKYGLNKSICSTMADAALLHDIGSTVIPDSLFDKNDPSAHRALLQIRRRPIAGAELINLIFADSPYKTEKKYAYEICRHMYEHFDGKGYPNSLVGQEIPLCAQIVSLAHRYDELRFNSGNLGSSHKNATRKILEVEFKAYNPDVLEAFEELTDVFEAISLGEKK